jgi:Ser/Thr protein kinase RdoA (MazF antagonist)
MADDLFLKLTPDWVIRAVEAGGFLPTGHVLGLHCLENRVYDLKLEDDRHVIAKFYRPGRWTREAIEEEHAFLLDLEEAEVPVCAPLRFRDGQTIHEVEGILYGVWPRTGGRSPEELNDEEVGQLGRLVARIHNVGATKTFEHRGRLDADSYGTQAAAYLIEKGFLLPQYASRYRHAVEDIAAIYERLAVDVPHIRIHADCHRGNLLRGRDGWFFLDFDDSLVGPVTQDIWLLVPDKDQDGVHKRAAFVEAYRQFRDFEPRWLRLVEPLRALRYVRYAAWIARRIQDPAFPASYPHFNTEAYWERETQDLEAQARECALAI